MSTIASLIGMMNPTIRPWAQGQREVADARRAETLGQTGLRELADLKRKQEAEAFLMERIKNDPEIARQLFGGSVLGSLGQAPGPGGGPPGGAPMTQQAFGAGQPPGAPTVVPGGQDLSRFANVPPQSGGPIPPDVMAQTMPTVTPPQGPPGGSVLASLGGQPQGPGPAPGPQNPLLEMARRDPRAALMLQQQMQGQQDAAMKRQEQNLKLGAATLGYVGQQAQGVTDQASLDAMRSDLQSQELGKYAAQLPQMYSKEAMQPFIAKALDVKEALTLQMQDLTAQAAVIRARKEGRSVDVDNQLRAMGVPPGQETPAQIKEALQAVEDAKVRVSASHGTGQIVKGPTGEYIRVKPGTDQVEVIKGPGGEPLREKPSEAEQKGATLANSVAAANTLATELEDKGYKPSVWEKGIDKLPLGLGNYVTSSDYQKYRQTVREFASAWLYGVSGAQITDSEWENANQTFFPQPNEDKGAVDLKRQRRAALVEQLRQQSQTTGRTGTQAQPTSQGSAKPVSQMNAEETRAEIAAIKARGGR